MLNVLSNRMERPGQRGLILSLLAPLLMACGSSDKGRGEGRDKDTVLVFVAASLTNAIRPQLDSFSAATGTRVLTESGGSMEHVRKLTELHRIPDLLLLADDEVFEKYLVPNYTGWWADFARNRLVLAYTDRSQGHDVIADSNWYSVVTRKGVETGRGDPALAPVGYRTLAMFALAELHYGKSGLARSLAEAAPAKNVRANAAELAALLASGELDYIYEYESVAQAQGFRYVVLPMQVTGRPIVYALGIPIKAAHRGQAERLVEFLTSSPVRDRLRASHVDMLQRPVPHGVDAPSFLSRGPD